VVLRGHSLRGAALVSVLVLSACASEPVVGEESEEPDAGSTRDGTLLEFEVPATGRIFLDLSEPAVVQAGDSLEWDLAIEGYDVYTNGGASGPGAGASFGPLSAPTFLSDSAPAVPFLTRDEPGGAFLRWYAYDGSDHSVLSRFHVYGIREGERFFKVQVLSYYAEESGAPVSGAFTVRYAEVTESGAGPTRVASALDATEEQEATECLELGSGESLRFTAEEARVSEAWHLCFRRESISVNGGSAGPRGVDAVDLDAASTDSELLDDVRRRTAQSELARFEAVDRERLTDPSLSYRPDGVTSAFSGRWLRTDGTAAEPQDHVWFVLGADGLSRYLVRFDGFSGASAESPGRVALRVKAVR